MKYFKIFLAGSFVDSKLPQHVINPYNTEMVAGFYLADEAIYERAVRSGLGVMEELQQMSCSSRYESLMYIANGLQSRKEEFANIITLESAKPMRYSLSEVDRAIQTFVVAAEESRRLPGEIMQLDWTAAGKNKEGIVKYFPIGLIGGIAPFNFPLNLAVHKIAPALACGCPIILKPASLTPLSTLLLAEIVKSSGFPDGSLSVLPMNRQTGNIMVGDPRIKLLSFTGSPEVGWKMKSQCGKKKVVLELGGNAGVIVTDSADIMDAVRKCIIGGFSYSGQVCIHTQRIYIAEEQFQNFVDAFVEGAKNLHAGDPMNPSTEISSMIDETNAIRVEEWVKEAVSSGASLLCGGKRENGWYEPSVLTNTSSSMKVCSHEVFGPVAIVEKFKSFKEAVDFINEGDFGLQAGVFTNRIDEMNYAFQKLEVGGVIINDVPTFRVDHMPYGGVKESGLGREGVKYAMMDMLEPRILVKPVL